jgi:hypothetical protein
MIRPFQPSYFSPCNSDKCNEKQPKCQKAQYSDDFFAQFGDPKNLIGTNIVTNGDFESGDLTGWSQTNLGLADWAIDGSNQAFIDNAESEWLYQCMDLADCPNNYVHLEFLYNIQEYSTLHFGTCNSATSLVQELGTISDDTGIWDGWFNPTYDCLYFYITKSGGENLNQDYIDNIIIYKASAAGELRDCCDVKIADLDPCDFTYGCSEYTDLAFKWSDYVSTPGRFKICLKNVEILQNYHFLDGDENWDQTIDASQTDWIFGTEPSDRYYHTAYAENINDGYFTEIISQDVDLPNCDYLIVITTVPGGMGGTTSSGILHVWINGEDIYQQNFNADENIQFHTQINAGWYYPITQLGFQIESTGAGSDYYWDSISLKTDICSPCYCLDKTQDCTLLIEARNNEDAFGFHFDTATKFSLRLESELLNFKSEFNEALVESSSGVNQLYFSQFKHLKDLKIYGEAEEIWQALEMMLLCTDFRINKIQYTKKEGAIEKTFIRDLQTYSGAIPVLKKTQNYKNYY